MADPAFIGNLSGIAEGLPMLILLSDIAFYVFGILFFGSIALKGYRGFLEMLPSLGLRIVMGLISMVGGIGLRGYFPQLAEGLLVVFNADILAGALLASIILGVGLYLISFRLTNIHRLEEKIHKMQERIKKAKHLSPKQRGMKDPIKIVGVVLIVGFVAFSLIGFHELPRASDGFLSFMGLSRDDFDSLTDQISGLQDLEEGLPEACESMLSILQATGPDLTQLPQSSDASLTALIESGTSSSVIDVRIATVSGVTYYVGTTNDGQLCHAKADVFCGCLDLSSF